MTVVVCWAQVADANRLLRETVTGLIGVDPGPVFHSCPHCGSAEHGRPYVDARVSVSIAHAPGLSIVAVSAVGVVGVDVEAGHDVEWSRREAVAKAHGTGMVGEELGGEAWVDDLDVPTGYVGAVAVLSRERPEVRVIPWHTATGRTGDAATAG